MANGNDNFGYISTEMQAHRYVEWKIRGLFSLPEEVDYCLSSPSFTFRDAEWCLRLYPNGRTRSYSTDWIDLLLVRKHSDILKHHVEYHIGFSTYGGTVKESWHREKIFVGNDCAFGVVNMVKRSTLNAKLREMDLGTVTFFCYLQVKRGETAKSRLFQDGKSVLKRNQFLKKCEEAAGSKTLLCLSGVSKLAEDLKQLLSDGEDSDLTIKVKYREFNLHKSILRARSPVFYAMLHQDMVEKNSGIVEIVDCEPDAFSHFLTYIYSGEVKNISNSIVSGLYFIADKYLATEVKIKCVDFMLANLSLETFRDVLTVSLRHNESDLLEKVTCFFAQNLKKIIVTISWQTFLKENPMAANELFIKAMDRYRMCK